MEGKVAIIKKCPKKDLDPNRPKSEQIWCLYDSKGERLLGRFPTKEKALEHERAIQYFKHKGSEIIKKFQEKFKGDV